MPRLTSRTIPTNRPILAPRSCDMSVMRMRSSALRCTSCSLTSSADPQAKLQRRCARDGLTAASVDRHVGHSDVDSGQANSRKTWRGTSKCTEERHHGDY